MTSREEIIRTLALSKITLRFPLYGLRRKVKTFLTILCLKIEAKNRSFETEESNSFLYNDFHFCNLMFAGAKFHGLSLQIVE